MKLTLTKYSKDGRYTDVRIAEVGFNCPYAIKFQVRRFCITLYRWSCLTLCISMANSDENKGGDRDNWAKWVLWQDCPWKKFHYWKAK